MNALAPVLTPFRTLIREKCGVTFKNDALHVLEAAVNKRISTANLSGHDEYLKVVRDSEEELHRLIDLITINETYFMREGQHFGVLCETIMPELLSRKTGKIKILSAGCSTGEEAYSILISLIEKYGIGIKKRVEIYGVDIDRNVIKTAKEAVYGNNSFRNDERMLMKYFEPRTDKRYGILPLVKEGVDFQVCNLLRLPYPGELQKMDVIFYRNVSIYFDREVQSNIFQNLSNILNPEGYLFLSSTETYYHNVGILSLKECNNVFLYHKKISMGFDDRRKYKKTLPPLQPDIRAAKMEPSLPPVVQPKPVVVEKRRDARVIFDEALADAMQKKYRQSIAKLDELLKESPDFLKAYALKASLLVNLQEMDAAREVCNQILEKDEWNLEAHLLLGIAAKIGDALDEALKMFKGALYINATCWLAHYYLADIYFSQHDVPGAHREYGIALKLLETRGVEDHGLTYFPLSFPVEQLIHLCRHNIDKIRAQHQKD
ncbi:MAG: methyltransferase domain-containing protein [Gallionella sp.]|nr:methyltransferase domain-containing protein [Gallionella sp.]